MGLIIVIIDGGITVEKDADTVESYPSGTTSLTFNNGAITSQSEITQPFIIKSNDTVANQVNSIDDNRTGGAGPIALPATVRLLYDLLNPFFFRVIPVPESSIKGGYNAATNTPDLDTAPSGIKKGDLYVVTVSGTFFTEAVESGDSLIALIDDPTVLSDWIRTEGNNDYTLQRVLTLGNTTANAQTIDAENGGGQLHLRYFADNAVLLSNDSGAYGESGIFLDADYAVFFSDGQNAAFETNQISLGNYVNAIYTNGTRLVMADKPSDIALSPFLPSLGGIHLINNATETFTTPNLDNYNTIFSGKNISISIGVKNSAATGINTILDKSGYLQLMNLEVQGLMRYRATPTLATSLDIVHRGYVDSSKWININVLLGTAKTHYVVVPFGTKLKRISTVVFGTTATAPETITTKNNADTLITNGVVTIATGAIAKEVDTAVPTANNTFATNDVLTVEVGGENTNAVECEITFEFGI